MKCGFIAHPTNSGLKAFARTADLINRVSIDLRCGYSRSAWSKLDCIPLLKTERIQSLNGSTCGLILKYLPLTADEILHHPRETLDRLMRILQQFSRDGAELVGLGGATSIIGDRGLVTAQRSPVKVTSGNSLTTYATVSAIDKALARLDINPNLSPTTIVGFPGTIATALAKILNSRGWPLILVHRRGSNAHLDLQSLMGRKDISNIELNHDIESVYSQSDVFIGATSSGGVIKPEKLQPGSIVFDVALPRDIVSAGDRRDILTLDCGLVSARGGFGLQSDIFSGTPSQQINGCIAETLVLALENRAECLSIGTTLDIEKIMEIGNLANEHGLAVEQLYSFGEIIQDWQFDAVSSARKASYSFDKHNSSIQSAFHDYVNPVMSDFLRINHIDSVFVKAEGCSLWDSNGVEHLDFVAGYGCLNMGHNHPKLVESITKFLTEQRPVFIQYVSIPECASVLAERLCAIAPGNMGRVFFSNSGTESIEAALKIARAATHRSSLIYLDNSYHGKTMGALSVTGRDKHRKPFYPLLPDCIAIPTGNLDALESAFIEHKPAGFIVEPIQGEGGVCMHNDGYLSAVEQMCHHYNVLLIVDEVQTGLGRTGTMFACTQDNVKPDILCLAKSLSGGMIPIGATLTRSDIWDAAYGTVSNFSLHTSTFGGNNLACTVGLAALKVIEEEDLCSRAESVGNHLKQKLVALKERFPFIRDVRGKGLMLGIEFSYPVADSFSAAISDLATRLPGDWQGLYRLMPDTVRDDLSSVMGRVEDSVEEMFCLRIVSKLRNDHHILGFMTANNNKVLRIQPPLVISLQQADRFAAALEETCTDFSTCF